MRYRFKLFSTRLFGGAIAVALTGAAAVCTAPIAMADSGSASAVQTSTPEQSTPGLPITGSKPSVSGTMMVGETLTAHAGVWEPSDVTLDYQWYSGWERKVPGATGVQYTLTPADAGQVVYVIVTGSKPGYEPFESESDEAEVAPGKLTAAIPQISGTVAVGKTLTADPGVWGPAGVELSYQWYSGWEMKAAGATSSTYTLTAADAGKPVYVMVTGTLPGYEAFESESKEVYVPFATLTAATPKISGTAAVGKKLTASAGSWKPAGVSFKYRWLRNGKAITGATKSTYTLVKSDAGTKVTVKVTGSKTGYTTVSKTSAAKSVAKLLTPATPKITGTAKVGKKLTASTGSWKPSGISFKYQWLRSGKAISKATKSTYTLTKSDAGKKISVKVTGSKSGYTTAARTSKATAAVKR